MCDQEQPVTANEKFYIRKVDELIKDIQQIRSERNCCQASGTCGLLNRSSSICKFVHDGFSLTNGRDESFNNSYLPANVVICK